ncbi:MAG: translation initiation factor IF-2 [Desulfovibrio sp.]|nr:translation initiation factor IF-2 [Desulfovibrio sp.]
MFSTARRTLLVLALCAGLAAAPSVPLAASAYSPRHSGLEPPGGPRSSQNPPGKSASRTPQGGMGYTDAYGNTLDDARPEENKPQRRLSPGAYAPHGGEEPERPLPDPQAPQPLWSFQ